MTSEVAERYAQGLFELARENDTIKRKKEQAELLLEAMGDNPEIALLLRAVKITKEEKKDFIEKSFKKVVDGDMIRLMKLLIDKGRIVYLQQILTEYVRLANEELGIVIATVFSARKLSKADMTRIRQALQKKTGKQIVISNHVDPTLIAGIKVTVGNNVTDATMKKKIDSMKEALLKGGQA